MAINVLTSTENGANSLADINQNFSYLNNPLTTEIHIDSNRTDTYIEIGSMSSPYKSISHAVTAMNASSYGSFVIRLAPGTYTESSSVTFPSKPVVLYGQGSTFVAVGGVTFPKQFDIYDLTIVGNVTQSDTSLTTIHNFQSGYIQGSLTVSGLCAFNGMATDTSGTITINSGATMTIGFSSFGFSGTGSGAFTGKTDFTT